MPPIVSSAYSPLPGNAPPSYRNGQGRKPPQKKQQPRSSHRTPSREPLPVPLHKGLSRRPVSAPRFPASPKAPGTSPGFPCREYPPALPCRHFEPYDRLQAAGLSVEAANYNLIYAAELTPGTSLEREYPPASPCRYPVPHTPARDSCFPGCRCMGSAALCKAQEAQTAAEPGQETPEPTATEKEPDKDTFTIYQLKDGDGMRPPRSDEAPLYPIRKGCVP